MSNEDRLSRIRAKVAARKTRKEGLQSQDTPEVSPPSTVAVEAPPPVPTDPEKDELRAKIAELEKGLTQAKEMEEWALKEWTRSNRRDALIMVGLTIVSGVAFLTAFFPWWTWL